MEEFKYLGVMIEGEMEREADRWNGAALEVMLCWSVVAKWELSRTQKALNLPSNLCYNSHLL